MIIPHPVSAASFNLYGSATAGWGSTSSLITQPGPTLTVQPGESVSLTLFSADGRPHQFCVDYESPPDYVCQGSELATQSPMFTSSTTGTTFPFTAPTMPGTYTYFCTIHRSAMTGQFIVSSPPPTPDFSIASNPTSMTVQQGASVVSTITLTSLNGFAGTINLDASAGTGNGLSSSLAPTSVTLSSGSSASSTVTIKTANSTSLGTYQVTITGTSGSIMRSVSMTVTVNAATPQISFPIIVGGAIAVVAAIGVAGYIVLRARRSKR